MWCRRWSRPGLEPQIGPVTLLLQLRKDKNIISAQLHTQDASACTHTAAGLCNWNGKQAGCYIATFNKYRLQDGDDDNEGHRERERGVTELRLSESLWALVTWVSEQGFVKDVCVRVNNMFNKAPKAPTGWQREHTHAQRHIRLEKETEKQSSTHHE